MKFNKKTTMFISFTLGTLLFATTAFADIMNKSGYELLKDSIKTTAEQCSETLNSYTMEMTLMIKDNGKVLASNNEVMKYDRLNSARETSSYQEGVMNPIYSHYSYEDKSITIRKGNGDETYYVTEYVNERPNLYGVQNSFKEEGAEDIERIVDALVGGLKDHVVVTQNPDGSQDYSGSLNEMQIPALVNAVASFQLKQEFNGNRNKIPNINKDIFVKEVSGFAAENPAGILESIRGTAVLSGKDSSGLEHEFSFELLVTLKDINTTVVTKPDLTDKKTVKEVAQTDKFGPQLTNPQKFIGKFNNDIIIEKDGQFVKIGERFVEISQIDNSNISGKYYEVYKSEFEQYEPEGKSAFTFSARFDQDPYHANLTFTDDTGAAGNGSIYLDQNIAKVYLNFDLRPINNGLMYDSIFSPALD